MARRLLYPPARHPGRQRSARAQDLCRGFLQGRAAAATRTVPGRSRRYSAQAFGTGGAARCRQGQFRSLRPAGRSGRVRRGSVQRHFAIVAMRLFCADQAGRRFVRIHLLGAATFASKALGRRLCDYRRFRCCGGMPAGRAGLQSATADRCADSSGRPQRRMVAQAGSVTGLIPRRLRKRLDTLRREQPDCWISAMQRNLLILRASPDWNTFDIELSRGFLRSLHLPEDLVIEFAALWEKHFKVDYRSVRAQLKALALQTYDEVRQASLLRHEEWDDGQPGGRVAFVDDDDWMSPSLFESLPSPTSGEDGVRWGSLRVGRIFAPNGHAEPPVQRRPLDRIVYTNNYAVTARALRRLGRAAVFEHDAEIG